MRPRFFAALALIAGTLLVPPVAQAQWDHDGWGGRPGWGYHPHWDGQRHDEWREHRAREQAYQQGFANGWAERRAADWRRFHPGPPPQGPRSYYYFGFGRRD